MQLWHIVLLAVLVAITKACMVVKIQYAVCVVELPVCIHSLQQSESYIGDSECGWQILFCRVANLPYPYSQAFAAFVVAAFLQWTNAARDLTQPRPHYCVLNQRDLKKIEEQRWQSTAGYSCSCVLWCTSSGGSISHLVLPAQDWGRYIWLKDQAAENVVRVRVCTAY